MPKFLCLLLCISLAAHSTRAQDAPVPDPADVASVDAIIAALYDVISGPAGPRDWDRLRSLTTPSCRLTPTARDSTGAAVQMTWTVEEYINRVDDYFENNGFFEVETARTSERYGNVVHAFSTYESFRSLEDEAPFMRGINSIQVLYGQGRWWIHSVAWQPEWPDLPIPDQYLPAGSEH